MNRLFQIIIKAPLPLLIIYIALTVFLAGEMIENSRMETDLDEYMPQDHPAFIYSNEAEDIFDIKDGIIIAIEKKGKEGIYNSGTLKKVKDLTKDLQKYEEIRKSDVTSLYTADNIVGTEFGLDVKSFYDGIPKTEEKLKSIRENVLDNEMINNRLVSENEEITLVIAEIEDSVFTMEFYNSILNLAHSYEGPENIYVAGTPIVEGTMAYLGPKDMKRMVPIVIVIIIIVLLLLLRSIRNTVFTLLVVLFSTIWAFGLMALFNVPIYAVSTMIPVMLIAIGVADGIHLYSHLDLFLFESPNAEKKEAVMNMLKNMWKPVVMTSVTTAVGFISLLTSEVYPIKYFGLFTAFGVMMAMVFSLTLIPAGILLFGLPKRKAHSRKTKDEKGKLSYVFAEGVVKYKALVISITLIVAVISIYGTTKVWINTSFLEKFEKDSDIVQTDKFINEHFGGTSSLDVVFEAENYDEFKNPEVLRIIDEIQDDSERNPAMVGNSFSLTDYLKRMNKVMHADSEDYNKVPDTHNLVAQYLLLYEMSGDPENLWKVVDYNYKKANLTLQLKSDNSKVINAAIDLVEKYRTKMTEHNIKINYAGSGYKALVFSDLILTGQIKSLVISLIIIIILLSVMFKKIKIGFIGAVPIVITAIISFGVMGLLNIPLSTTTALISSIAVGIGIDYAVHFIERYKIYALQTRDKNDTIKETMHHSGRAIIFNAMVVIAGFLVLLFSVFPPNRALGALVSLNMFTSFLGTITIMFLLLYRTNVYFKNKNKRVEND